MFDISLRLLSEETLLSSASKTLKILSAAAIPFIAIWKYDPNNLRGMKNSADINKITIIPPRLTVPALNCNKATILPRAAPPKAIKSITFIEFNCILKTFIVIFLKLSASSFISSCLSLSTSKTFNVVSP